MWFIHLCKHILYSITFISWSALISKKIMRCRTIRTCASLLTAKNINRNGYAWFPLSNQVTWKNPFNRQPFGKYTAENQSTIVISQNNFSGVVSNGPANFNQKSLRFHSKTILIMMFHQPGKMLNIQCSLNRSTSWWFQPTPLKNLSQNGFIFPNFRGETWKKYWKKPRPRF